MSAAPQIMAIKKSVRFRVLRRCQFRCHYCGRRAGDVTLEIDHVIPRSRGGSDNEANLVAACEDCNLGKGSEVEAEYQWVQDLDGKWHYAFPDAARPSRAEMCELLGYPHPGLSRRRSA